MGPFAYEHAALEPLSMSGNSGRRQQARGKCGLAFMQRLTGPRAVSRLGAAKRDRAARGLSSAARPIYVKKHGMDTQPL